MKFTSASSTEKGMSYERLCLIQISLQCHRGCAAWYVFNRHPFRHPSIRVSVTREDRDPVVVPSLPPAACLACFPFIAIVTWWWTWMKKVPERAGELGNVSMADRGRGRRGRERRDKWNRGPIPQWLRAYGGMIQDCIKYVVTPAPKLRSPSDCGTLGKFFFAFLRGLAFHPPVSFELWCRF